MLRFDPMRFSKTSGHPYGNNSTTYTRGYSTSDANGNPFSILFVNTIIAGGGTVDLIGAHEMGHDLGLSVRVPDDVHDPGPFPIGTDGLMKSGAPDPTTGILPANPGRWLSHEDWKAANDNAKDYAP